MEHRLGENSMGLTGATEFESDLPVVGIGKVELWPRRSSVPGSDQRLLVTRNPRTAAENQEAPSLCFNSRLAARLKD